MKINLKKLVFAMTLAAMPMKSFAVFCNCDPNRYSCPDHIDPNGPKHPKFNPDKNCNQIVEVSEVNRSESPRVTLFNGYKETLKVSITDDPKKVGDVIDLLGGFGKTYENVSQKYLWIGSADKNKKEFLYRYTLLSNVEYSMKYENGKWGVTPDAFFVKMPITKAKKTTKVTKERPVQQDRFATKHDPSLDKHGHNHREEGAPSAEDGGATALEE